MSYGPMLIALAALVAAVHLDASGGHLVAVLLGLAAVQGSVLVVAAAELSNGRWIDPLKKHLLALAPLQLVFVLLVKLAPYAWREQPTAWLSEPFFLARGAGLLLVTALIALGYRRAVLRASTGRSTWAVLYILSFVLTQTVVSIDWVMSFEYPWVSTMFPVLFMVEAFSAGLGVAGVIGFLLTRRAVGDLRGPVYDTATLLFGFALFWGGLFFAQYLTIWYGNLPEEVAFFTRRFAQPGGVPLFVLTTVLLFGFPFAVLLIHKARRSPTMLFVLANTVFVGVVVHRWFELFPHVQPRLVLLFVQMLAAIVLVGAALRRSLQEA